MKELKVIKRTRAQESTSAIERIYVTMRHLFNRGFYKPMGVSGKALREALLTLRPEIYGSIREKKAELQGLMYVMDRLPEGIDACRFINLTSDEGYKNSHFKVIIPPKRRRNCYRIDEEQMNIEITRGKSDIYDILTHLTFLYIESYKIIEKVVIDEQGTLTRDWEKLEDILLNNEELTPELVEKALVHCASCLGRTFQELKNVYPSFSLPGNPHRLLWIIYNLGRLAIDEVVNSNKRVITFSPVLRERIGHHIHGERWALDIKEVLYKNDLIKRPLHIISANMHSVMNTLFAKKVLGEKLDSSNKYDIYEALSDESNEELRNKVFATAQKHGMFYIPDRSGTNINVQVFDTSKLPNATELFNSKALEETPVIVVMDYAFGEQAFETMDELLRPYEIGDDKQFMNVKSVSIMGKAGILEGGKGDIMIPTAHVFEGTADNYPLKNEITAANLTEYGIDTYTGSMISVLGTSLQNKDVLSFFQKSTWNVIGLEMEGAHYQKAIQAASRIRGSISPQVKVRYAYYASDNPLETGSTLASGGLGTSGVKPTYAITDVIIKQILKQENE